MTLKDKERNFSFDSEYNDMGYNSRDVKKAVLEFKQWFSDYHLGLSDFENLRYSEIALKIEEIFGDLDE